jgi:hypothetical protein
MLAFSWVWALGLLVGVIVVFGVLYWLTATVDPDEQKRDGALVGRRRMSPPSKGQRAVHP